MMGGIIPTYAAERGMRVQVVYCYVPEQYRHEEALNGLWFSGMRTLPVFFVIENESRLRFAEKITREIRRFKPEVVITHDIMGEYGQYEYKNPQSTGHGLVSKNCREAVEAASDPKKFPKSAEEYGTWQVKKLYLHLYGNSGDQTVFDWTKPMEKLGGRTGMGLAYYAYLYHKTQDDQKRSVYQEGIKYRNNTFGLAESLVGPDLLHDDLLENIPLRPPPSPPRSPPPSLRRSPPRNPRRSPRWRLRPRPRRRLRTPPFRPSKLPPPPRLNRRPPGKAP